MVLLGVNSLEHFIFSPSEDELVLDLFNPRVKLQWVEVELSNLLRACKIRNIGVLGNPVKCFSVPIDVLIFHAEQILVVVGTFRATSYSSPISCS